MAERIDQLEDALIGTGIQENVELLERCGDIYHELVEHHLLEELTHTETTVYYKGSRVVDEKEKKSTCRNVKGYLGTLNEWKERFQALKKKLGDPPRGGTRGFTVRLLLCVLVPLLLWFFPPAQALLSQPWVYLLFYLFVVFGIPAITAWALVTGDWDYPDSIAWEAVTLLAPFVLPIALFIGFLAYLNHMEHSVQGRLVLPELLMIFTVFYVLLFLLRFRLIRDARLLLSGKAREMIELRQQALARLDPILQRVDAAIRRPSDEYHAAFNHRLIDSSTTMEELREGFRYVKEYYSSLYSFFK